MVNEIDTRRARQKRHARVRSRVSGSSSRPRLCVFRSLNHIYVQAVDDALGSTVANASTLEMRKSGERQSKTEAAKKVGALIAERLKAKGLDKAVFDRGGYLYHGRVKAVADAARKAGLVF